ncbi:MAG TPA: SAM-dependent chlorinase/fluorinase [Pseudonocardiaceae bacterium]
MSYDWVSFTTDYGLADGFVAACTGVIGRIAPHVRVIDISHDVPPQDVRRGAVVLAQTVPHLPPAVHLAVVDPGVGTARRGLVVVTGNGVLVGPDNGLLLPAATALGGIVAAHELTESEYWLPEVSRTFHGRDVFAPVTAHLARGVPPERFGPAIPPEELVVLPEPRVVVEPGRVDTEVLTVDHFGNLQLAATAADWARSGLDGTGRVRLAGREVRVGGTFADARPGELVVYVDSAGRLAVAVNGGNAAAELGLRSGASVLIEG